MTIPRSRPPDCARLVSPVRPVELDDAIGAPGAQERLIAGFKALGDPTRFAVFRLIAAQAEPICVCDIVERFDLSQPTISHHLKALREAGLVTVSRRGVWAYYAADPRGLALLRDGLGVLIAPSESPMLAVVG